MTRPMPTASKSLVSLEQSLAERLLDFDRLDEAWPIYRGASVIIMQYGEDAPIHAAMRADAILRSEC